MGIEEKVKLHKEISKKIEELEGQKKAIGVEIMQTMESKTLQVPGYLVRRYSRLLINTPLDEARSFDAVKWEETVDKEKIKSFYQAGQQVSGVSELHYIQISEEKSGDF